MVLLLRMANVAHYTDATSLLMKQYKVEKQRASEDIAKANQRFHDSQKLQKDAQRHREASKKEQHASNLEKQAAEEAEAKEHELHQQGQEKKKESQSDLQDAKLWICLQPFASSSF